MNILSIDTTTKAASVALKNNDNIISKRVENDITHSEKLLPLIDEVLKEKELNINEIDMFTTLNGPGSFTGVRIGLATIKAFTMVNDKPIFSISALEAIAYLAYIKENITNEKYILSLINAKNNRVYYGLYKIYKKENKIAIEEIYKSNNDLIENTCKNISSHITTLINNDVNILIAGDCINDFKEILTESYPHSTLYEVYPTADAIIEISENIYNKEKYIFNSYTLDANYIRPSQAERMKNEKANK